VEYVEYFDAQEQLTRSERIAPWQDSGRWGSGHSAGESAPGMA
jgi:hypothetical protein